MLLKLDEASVFYGEMQALWGVSLEVAEKELVALVGANGAGKTTTLKTISGLIRLNSGSIEFDGVRIDWIPPHQLPGLGIVHVPEGRRLFPLMTVTENLVLGALSDRAKAKRRETMGWVFEMFPRLRERRTQLAETLSGGEQQMLAIGRGLMARPRLLMLDEPSLGLAPILVKEVFEAIRSISREGVAVLLVEQNVRQALSLASRGYVLENGRIVLSDSGLLLLENPLVKKAYLGT